jgi:hypothetical protein
LLTSTITVGTANIFTVISCKTPLWPQRPWSIQPQQLKVRHFAFHLWSREIHGPDRVGRRMVWTVDHATPDRACISNPVLVRPCWMTDGMDRGPCNTGPCLDQYFCVGPSTLDRSCVGVLLGSIHHPRLKIISKKCSVCVTYSEIVLKLLL